MVTKKKDTYDVPSTLLKEIQRTIALVVVDKLLASSAMKLSDQQDFCFKEYHGSSNDDTLGQALLFLQGRLHYEDAFDERVLDVTQSDATENKQHVLKTVLTQDADCLLHVNKHLTQIVLTQVSKKKTDLISGRQIKTIGELAKKNILKATAFADSYCKNTECEKGPSGHNLADLYHHVLEKMYFDDLASGGDSGESNPRAEEETVVVSNEQEDHVEQVQGSNNKPGCPNKWIFPGFMGFVLFSTHAPTNDNVLAILKANNYQKGSQKDACTTTKAAKDKKRSQETCRGSGDSPFQQGLVLESRHKLAILEQQEKRISANNNEHMIGILVDLIKTGHTTNNHQFKIATRFGKDSNGKDDEQHPHWVSYFEGVQEVATNRKKLAQLRKQIKEEQIREKQLVGTKRSLAAGLLCYMSNKENANKKSAKSTPVTVKNGTSSAVSSLSKSTSANSQKIKASNSYVPLVVVGDISDGDESALPIPLVLYNEDSPNTAPLPNIL